MTTPTIDSETSPTDSRKRRGRRIGLLGLVVLALPVAALGISSLNVSIPFLPAVGESTAQACDSDGVTTSFTYGNTSAQGIKITAITVSDISTDCSLVSVDFLSGETVAATYSGSVTGTTVTLTTNIFTNNFTSVRVLLTP